MRKMQVKKIFSILLLFVSIKVCSQREIINFNNDWKFYLGDDSLAKNIKYDDAAWRKLDLPHDWSIEGSFDEKNPTTFNQGALPAGIGWYRKSFQLPVNSRNKRVYINFDGVYRNSEVWINGHFLGKRPYGYSSFQYDVSRFIFPAGSQNIIAVRVDNSEQPNSRWYTGSGIYRKVWLEITNSIAVSHWGNFIKTPYVISQEATLSIGTNILNTTGKTTPVQLKQEVFDPSGKLVAVVQKRITVGTDSSLVHLLNTTIKKPKLWSVEQPFLYRCVTNIVSNGRVIDRTETTFGIRRFYFDSKKGFFLNGKHLKILGVCNHHDLGALGAAVKVRAIERQLKLLKEMGCNAIRTAHNPPASELLDLCDKMGFLVMDEAFDIWEKKKNKYDYSIDFKDWHQQDLEDMVKRDRNHPSVIIWSIGNEIREQFDSTGVAITRDLVRIVKSVDSTRPVTSALTENNPGKNYIYKSGALDVLGFNYKLFDYPVLPERFTGGKFIATETASALATRGHYDLPSDSARIWPPDAKPFTKGNPDYTVTAYDNAYAFWGASHEESWKAVKKFEFIAGCFVWSGFDFLGEPVPYQWPARSSYYGIIDLAGFPKDVYYLYQSEWTKKPVLHLFPHWNWTQGQQVDVWAYYNNADEVELFLNGKSLGTQKKQGDSLHVMWRVKYQPGTIKAVSRKNGHVVLIKQIKTAGQPARIELLPDKKRVRLGDNDLVFITVRITDKDGNLVPAAKNSVQFKVSGSASIVAVDNGNPVSHEAFKGSQIHVYNGLALVILKSQNRPGNIKLNASSEGLESSTITLAAD
ncbi:MAG: beta-galactosidase GalB [Candidatus Dadabacteria bacterium]